jgi:hypothetical protein
MAADGLVLQGMSRAMALMCTALVDEDGPYGRRVLMRLRRALDVCTERTELAPDYAVTQEILQELMLRISRAYPPSDLGVLFSSSDNTLEF